ncbi:hypothetical protein KSP39_PZI001640 [Platanthera zijinensis]|uniref:Myb-like domain-containing protein n=1 Tax=Platanthera zijinensis TaxID=2320716 RepID=A0AAP0C0G7_9ASPA
MQEAVVQALSAPHSNEDTTGHQSPSKQKTRCLQSQEKQGTQSSQNPPSSRRTRSQAAPDWTMQEELILISEIAAIDEDWIKELSSYQRWKMVSDSCMAMSVTRSSSQCKSKWDTLLGNYRKIRNWESKSSDGSYWFLAEEKRKDFGLPASFPKEIFDAMYAVIEVRKHRSDSNNSDSDHIVGIPEFETSCADADSVGVVIITSRSLEMEEVTKTSKILEVEGLVRTSKSHKVEDLITTSKSLEREEVTRASKSPEVENLVITSNSPKVEYLITTSKSPKGPKVEDLITTSKIPKVKNLITTSKCPKVEDLITASKGPQKASAMAELITTTKSLEVEDLVTTSKSLEAEELITTSKGIEADLLITTSKSLEAEELITTSKNPTKTGALTALPLFVSEEEELITSSKSPKVEESIAISRTPVKLTVMAEEKVIHTKKSSEKARVMVDKLKGNAEHVCEVLRGGLQDGTSNCHLPLPNSLKLSATQTQFARRQADELIKALAGLTNNLDELCELVSRGSGCTGIKHVNSMA